MIEDYYGIDIDDVKPSVKIVGLVIALAVWGISLALMYEWASSSKK
jgi:hypothetical protein